MVTGNFVGFNQHSGVFNSLGTNHVNGNTFDTSGTIMKILPK